MGFVENKVALGQIIFQSMFVIYLPSGAQFFATAVTANVLTRAMTELLARNKDV